MSTPFFSLRDIWRHICVSIIPIVAVWSFTIVIYRRFFHPLSKVPGPFLGSVSELYYFYWQFIKNGSLYLQFERLTEEYGPIVRIGPNEVVLMDPENYDKIYSANTKFCKDPNLYGMGTAPTGIFATISNDVHRQYRAILNPFFSSRAVLDAEWIIQEKAIKFCRDIQAHRKQHVPTNMHDGFRAVSMDIVTEYAFGPENSWNFLERKDYASWYGNLTRAVAPMIALFRLIPVLTRLKDLPPWLAIRLNPVMKGYIETAAAARGIVDAVTHDMDAGVKGNRETIFHAILHPDNPHGPVPADHMTDEAWEITAAGANTTGNTLTIIAWRILNDLEVYAKLHAELSEAFPDPDHMPYSELEKLPYLTAVIKEGLRLSYGVLHHLPRVVPEGGVSFNGYFLPAGTVVGMSNWTMHRHPSAFPNPDKFDPERWLDADERRTLEKYLNTFSKGDRTCIGQNLAMAELYVVVGQVFRRFSDLRPYDTGPDDLVYEDYFQPFHPKHARPLRAVGPEYFE